MHCFRFSINIIIKCSPHLTHLPETLFRSITHFKIFPVHSHQVSHGPIDGYHLQLLLSDLLLGLNL